MTTASRRKTPQQARSKATVDALLEATAQLWIEVGYDKSSTNRIARRAGVSVGSLYQYFPNKEALALALIEHFADTQHARLRKHLQDVDLMEVPIEEAVRWLIEATFEAKKSGAELHRAIFEHAPHLPSVDGVGHWLRRASDMIEFALHARNDELALANPALTAHLIGSAVHGVIHHSVVHRREFMDDASLVDGVVAMVLSILGRG